MFAGDSLLLYTENTRDSIKKQKQETRAAE